MRAPTRDELHKVEMLQERIEMLKGSAVDLSRLSQVELGVEGFYMTGLRSDIVHVMSCGRVMLSVLYLQHACFLLALMQHVRLHMSLSTLEQTFLKHTFKDRLILEVKNFFKK